jgi:maltose O-acetyltransferase
MSMERDKMLAGERYDPLDPELVAARSRARDLCHEFNATRETDQVERRRILRELLGASSEDVWIQPPFFCDYGSNICLGQRCYFNFNCIILDVCQVRIGDFALFGPAVQIYTAMHPMDYKLRRPPPGDSSKVALEFGKPVEIGSDVWVGGASVVCPGVTIGDRTVIGAGSVVTRNIPPNVFAAGSPCRVIREFID